MSDDAPRALPAAPLHTVFLETGEEVAVYSGSDFGQQPEWDKRAMIGWGIVIRGLSEETFHEDGSNMRPARSVLYNVVDGWFDTANGHETFSDDTDTEPWGMLYTDNTEDPKDWATNREAKETAPVLKQVRRELKKNGGRPFLASISWVETVPAKGNMAAQGYYKLDRYVRRVPKDE